MERQAEDTESYPQITQIRRIRTRRRGLKREKKRHIRQDHRIFTIRKQGDLRQDSPAFAKASAFVEDYGGTGRQGRQDQPDAKCLKWIYALRDWRMR